MAARTIMDTLSKLKHSCEKSGAALDLKGEGHFHIRGERLVNYYPFSRRRTVYIPDSNETIHYVDPERAVELAYPSCLDVD